MRHRTDTDPRQTPTRLADYRPPYWLVDRVRLEFELDPTATRVTAEIEFRRNPERAAEGPADLRLDGRSLIWRGAKIDGTPLADDAVAIDGEGLTVAAAHLPGERFTWRCETEIDPAANTALEGLYISKGMYCTQCEAEGFRKITFYPDRPDVMAPFEVRIEAPEEIPVLLSNGNPVTGGGTSELVVTGGTRRRVAVWHDPHPKPAYLFALVAGDLVAHRDRFTTASGRDVELAIWVRPGDEAKCAYAMDALKRSMRWDEETHGREYDLDIFQIVAVDDFNMGAMENKGLNIFNAKYVLASPETATDQDYERIESIVAHEYFHNWTGNRITCRDWFQLCLKEGLTVYRDQRFSADMRSEPVQRIADVVALRAAQFPEDQGPLAHPVRPEEYVEINNFYTATVYEKGAEVIGMLARLVGPEGYRAALDLYFERHDGQACTIEQFRACFEDACGRDLTQFARWWSQAGTPRVTVEEAWEGETLVLTLAQETPPTPGQAEKAPLVIPVAIGLIGRDGAEMLPTTLLELTEARQSWRIAPAAGTAEPLPEPAPAPEGNAPADGPAVLSVARGFSAPAIFRQRMTAADRALLLAHDTDPFARWEAGHRYALDVALAAIREDAAIPEAWTDALGRLLTDAGLDPAFRSRALTLPGADEIAGEIAGAGGLADPEAIHAARSAMRAALGSRLAGPLAETCAALAGSGPYSPDAAAAGRRALRNRCLDLRAAAGSPEAAEAAEAQFDTANNMTDRMAALTVLAHHDLPGAAPRLAAFHARFQGDAQVVDKWFTVQATAPLDGAAGRIAALAAHPAFDWKNPNRFRSLIGAFAMANPRGFHAADGAGYRLVTDWLLRLDPVNPQTTARLAGAFESWRRYTPDRQRLIRAELDRMAATPGLSKNTREIVERMRGG
ncbi:aminopeptidase N [Paralimibaculum aggregatum]|uniref:Aminopeptidase N n=1 Tax=Paralimibaculum aggregatum TaxID=3036245 RepID=A0ABQ6LDC7_9RHOB|nr:aminopeptidase N [Limibaculum sp. NKW23]GMG81364.1 aminopeptidase N [Limibaculum sp. NKW23]